MKRYVVLMTVVLALLGAGLGSRAIAQVTEPRDCVNHVLGPNGPIENRVECFDSYEAAMQSIGVDPDLYRPSSDRVQAGEVTVQSKDATDAADSKIRHCITGPDQPLACFPTEAAALRAASKGRIDLPDGATASSLSSAELAAANIQAVLYTAANYTGSTLTIFSDGCFGWNNMPAGWDNVVSSARTGDCGITLFENINLGGASLRINPPGTPFVGNAMNDQASSWRLP